jgi:HSP20 family molecular chaperone IbpA
MIRTLLSALNNADLRSELMETAASLRKTYSNLVSNATATFEEEGDSYVMVINVPETLTSSDVNVEYDDETNSVSVETQYKRGNLTYGMTVVETLPEDADVDTLAATVTNGVFTIVVDKLPVEELVEEPEVQVDPVKVTIKRKRKE